MDYSRSTPQNQEPVLSQRAPLHLNLQHLQRLSHPSIQGHPIDSSNNHPSTPTLELLSISGSPLTALQGPLPSLPLHVSPSASATGTGSLQQSSQQSTQLPTPDQPPVNSILWPVQPSHPQPFHLNNTPTPIMDSASWTGNSAQAHQTVGPIPMGFEWSRDQNIHSSDASTRQIGFQNAFHTPSNQNNGNTNGNQHQASSASLTGMSGPSALSHGHLAGEVGLSNNGIHTGLPTPTHHSGDPLASSIATGALQQQGDLQLRTSPTASSREDLHHNQHSHHHQQQQQQHQQQQPPQQQLHVHHTHSSYNHGQIPTNDLASHDQQQQSFQPSNYPTGHYYADPEQHDPYDHDRIHTGGLVGHAYGHSHDNLAALTPPPSAPIPQHDLPPLRTRLTNTIWEDEHTFCYQVDVKGVCVARRADNHMVNGTKLLNVVGMSRGKRDGILKNEKGRVVVKVGAMHLKGVWIPLDRAMHHAKAHNIEENLYPLLAEDPAAFIYQHPHTAAVSSDMRWTPQSQQHHSSYHDPESPKGRHHHFNQGIHGEYYSHQHQSVFRGHGVNSVHGSPHGSTGSVSGDDDPNLVSPFEYRVQSSMAAGGLIGIPSTGASVNDLRTGNHHAAYYGHQVSPNQYYGGAHVQQKYQDPILHPGQHQLQLGTPLANESSPPLLTPTHDGSQTRLQPGLLSGQKRGYGANVQEGYYYQGAPKSHGVSDMYQADGGQFGIPSSGMNSGNFSPPLSMTPSEPHSPMSQHTESQLQGVQGMARHGHGPVGQPLNPPSKRPRQVSRGISNTSDPSNNGAGGQWYNREDTFDRAGGQAIPGSHHSMSSNDNQGVGSVGYGMAGDSNGGIYYDNVALTSQQQQSSKAFNGPREGDNGQAGRPRFMPGAVQTQIPYGTAGPSSPQRSRSRLSSFQDGSSAGGPMSQQQGNMSPFGRVQNSMSPDDTKQMGYGRPPTGPEGDSNPQLVKVEGVSTAFGHDSANWS
ncbi:hypothetical protein BGW39_009554 [Mortierella sp. 14UC]|nr:hypothetical protein BGW39_009554 [Mortierella sp. 14UC]